MSNAITRNRERTLQCEPEHTQAAPALKSCEEKRFEAAWHNAAALPWPITGEQVSQSWQATLPHREHMKQVINSEFSKEALSEKLRRAH